MSKRSLLIGAVVLTALVASACSTAATETVDPFEQIAVSGPEIEVDPSGTAAVVTVETSIAAICAVSYGPGEPVGQIATDREMDPQGHTQHRAVLSGLAPDTEYAYRLQGVGVDGRLYQSKVFTFRTPAASESSRGPNLAKGASVVEVSSEFSPSFAGAYAVDGDSGTEWSSRGDGNDAYITLDLGQVFDIGAVAFRTREMSDGTAVTQTFTVTVDGGDTFGPFPAGPELVDVELRGRVLRFDVAESTGGNTGAVEVEVYGPGPG